MLSMKLNRGRSRVARSNGFVSGIRGETTTRLLQDIFLEVIMTTRIANVQLPSAALFKSRTNRFTIPCFDEEFGEDGGIHF